MGTRIGKIAGARYLYVIALGALQLPSTWGPLPEKSNTAEPCGWMVEERHKIKKGYPRWAKLRAERVGEGGD
jgi:hypothetical protein